MLSLDVMGKIRMTFAWLKKASTDPLLHVFCRNTPGENVVSCALFDDKL